MADNSKRFSLGTILTAGGLALGVATAVAALMSNVYCTKTELAEIKEKTREGIGKMELVVAKTDWQVQTFSVRIRNIERRQIQMGENITKLLIRLRVEPTTPPYLMPLPKKGLYGNEEVLP